MDSVKASCGRLVKDGNKVRAAELEKAIVEQANIIKVQGVCFWIRQV